MPDRTPLQIVVNRSFDDRRTDVYVDTLRVAFEGSADASGSPSTYLGDAVDLGIRVLEPARSITSREIDDLLGGAEHTVLVVVGDALTPELGLRVPKDHVVRVDPLPDRPIDPAVQGHRTRVESVFAPVVASLRAMASARRVLAAAAPNEDPDAAGLLRFFISHAKTDGLAMAKSLIGVLRQLQEAAGNAAGFEYFYDAEHIPPGGLWQDVLNAASARSILVALRSEAYESRYWCRQEFLRAESNGMPILAVDLRKEQYHRSALLPFDVVPNVRVHDGNLIRIVLHAMGVHLRALRVQYEWPSVKVLPHRPSVYSLGRHVAAGAVIAYPGPKVPHAFRQAVAPILSSTHPAATLKTYDELP